MRHTLAIALGVLGLLACDGGLQPELARTTCPAGFVGVCGTVRIRGSIPDSTDLVLVLAYRTFPQTCADIPTFVPFPPPAILLGDTIATYALPLPSGSYDWIVAVWKKLGTLTLTPADTALLREAGFYRDPADTARAGTVTVSGGAVDSVDFLVDLDNLHPVTDYVTCAVR